jgi:hypothetical protein
MLVGTHAVAAETVRPTVTLDAFEQPEAWLAQPADGVELKLSGEPGRHGRALRLDFDFKSGGGYAVARRVLAVDLPEDYVLSFWVRGEARPNHLEFKLVDASGDNVWWHVKRDFEFGPWRRVVIKKRQIAFAWGPLGGGVLKHAAAIEFAVTAGRGGRGTVWLDELELIPVAPETGPPPAPLASASVTAAGSTAAAALDTLASTAWRSGRSSREVVFDVDYGRAREFSAIELLWEDGRTPSRIVVEASLDGSIWDTLRVVDRGDRSRRLLWLPDHEARALRLRLAPRPGREVALRELSLRPVDWAPTRARFFERVAEAAPRGDFPRGMRGEQPTWTVLGVDGDDREALFSEDGAIESGKAGWTLEPFLRVGAEWIDWADVESKQGLVEPGAPIPWVRWDHPDVRMEVRAFPDGPPGRSYIVARYRLTGPPGRLLAATLVLAVRPFQVNPPTQFLNTPGGVAPIASLSFSDGHAIVNGEERITCLTSPAGLVASAFDQGDVLERLRVSPARPVVRASVDDPFAAASGALEFPVQAAAGDTADVVAVLSLYPGKHLPRDEAPIRDPGGWADAREAAVRDDWRTRLGSLVLDLPEPARDLAETVRANLAWILVNRDGPAIQPGSRAYERSWIRDGALTSTALLRAGRADVVRDFLLWFAAHQYPNGKVPCCVDFRGADPVPENDSHGELIYLIAEYARHTGDRETVERVWPNVRAAAAVIDSLRRSRRTAEYRTPARRAYFGVLPASISHEGYSAKPMHSYWDSFFGVRGLKDAAWLAGWLGRDGERAGLTSSYEEFAGDVQASLRLAMAEHRIDYLPGCVELGDFDATSTTIAISPVDEVAHLPPGALERTFEGYWSFFEKRRSGAESWDAFTPYELRAVGAFVRLGWRDRADQAEAWFMGQRLPEPWRQWPEVKAREVRAPRFIGDLPHTWVGSDFIRSTLDRFAFERESDSTLVVAAAIPEAWLRGTPGVRVRGLSTHYGTLALEVVRRGDDVIVSASGVRVPPGGIVVPCPLADTPREVLVDGARVDPRRDVVLRKLPATVTFR